MPLVHEHTNPGPRVTIQPSIAVELEWALASAERLDYRKDHAGLAAVYDLMPGLVERVRSLWPPQLAISCGGFIELMALAHSGGLLFSTEPDVLFGRLEALCRHAVDVTLASETEADRAAVRGRLKLLRTSAAQRRRYVEVVAEVWSSVGDIWERDGRAAVDRAVTVRRQLLASGAPWAEVARGDCDYGDELTSLVHDLGPTGELAVIPAYFTHLGLLIDLPGVLVVGVRVESSAVTRAATEHLARRLKAVSDATRLAILHSLGDGPKTVTDIAQQFALAQPTVSNHVKVLRDAGLVSSPNRGRRRELVLQPEGADELLEHLGGVLHRPNRATAAD